MEMSRSWPDRLRDALLEAAGEEQGNRLFDLYGAGFPASYQERVDARAAVPTSLSIDRLARDGGRRSWRMSLYRRLEDPADAAALQADPARPARPLSDALPILENMGLKVLSEEPSEIDAATAAATGCTISACSPSSAAAVEVDAVREHFQDLFSGVWTGRLENDGFNRLVLAAGLSPRQIVTLRAYCRYILQIGTPFSQAYIEQTLAANPGLATISRRCSTRASTRRTGDREELQAGLEARILDQLNQVASLDQDRSCAATSS